MENAIVKPVALAIVKFNHAATTIAVPMTKKQDRLYVMGTELGANAADNDDMWRDALKLVKTPKDRVCLRNGFVTAYVCGSEVPKVVKAAHNRFDYLSRMHANGATSRKAKHNAKRKPGGGRKEKTAGKGEHVPAQDVALRLTAVLAYIAKAQGMHAADPEMLEVLGEIAALAGGKTKKSK